jgi:predicted DsbA family dithiol-disulfide isomerase
MKGRIIALLFIVFTFTYFSQTTSKTQPVMDTTSNKFIVEIWSDIVCPFCYLGKRKFESAIEHFADRDHVQIQWKSFQLNPGVITDTSMTVYTYLSKTKGINEDVAKQMTEQITSRGKEVGIEYQFDETRVNNTFNAHCMLHFAQKYGKQNEAKERLLKAYFTEGINIDDRAELLKMGDELGLNREELDQALKDRSFETEVNDDIQLAQQFGISGVPFFVFDRKYAVSGAQETAVFLDTLKKSFSEWRKNNPEVQLEIIEGESCAPDKKCE